jgi:hypothetical protein
MRESDLLVLLGLLREGREASWSVRSISAALHMPTAGVQRALARLAQTPAYEPAARRVDWGAAEEVLFHAIPYIAPAALGAPTRGVPTAWGAEPLRSALAPSAELQPVWPAPEGAVRGLAVQPLHQAAIELSAADPVMYEALALIDGLRLGDARVRGLARAGLASRLAAWEAA